MRNTLFGYITENGKAVIVPEEAEMIRNTAKNYLDGASFVEAAEKSGLKRQHGTIRHMLQNSNYLGTDFYPPILDEQIFYAVQIERNRRMGWFDRDTKTRKIPDPVPVRTKFRMPSGIERKFEDPLSQAEYIYSLIESEGE